MTSFLEAQSEGRVLCLNPLYPGRSWVLALQSGVAMWQQMHLVGARLSNVTHNWQPNICLLNYPKKGEEKPQPYTNFELVMATPFSISDMLCGIKQTPSGYQRRKP